jgi:hypothetical protein
VCPEGFDLATMEESEANGCTSDVVVEEICVNYGYEDLTDHLNNMHAMWAIQWFEDNLAKVVPTINGRVVINNS